MADSKKNVIVFGPTGDIGRVAAIEAHKRGANVWLAMRNTSKAMGGIEEGTEGFTRVQADLSQPSSLKAAIDKSGATAAFVYTLHESEDYMLASFEALKAAGITYIVVVSSYSVKGAASDEYNRRLFIPNIHSQTEVSLDKSGIPFTALRPAYFNSNLYWNKAGIKKGQVEVLFPTNVYDFIAPEDIGVVAGALLVKAEPTKPIVLCGPKLYTLEYAIELIGKTLGHDIKVTEIAEDEFPAKNPWLAKHVAEAFVKDLREIVPPKSGYPKDVYEEASANVTKYGGIEPTKLEDWLERHKAVFA